MLGIWRDFDELESNLSMPELFAIIKSKRDLTWEERKFLAALQGADLGGGEPKKEDWRERVAENVRKRIGKSPSPTDVPANDVTRLKGARAKELGFGIGMGLDYSVVSEGNPLG